MHYPHHYGIPVGPKYTWQSLCRVLHTANSTRQTNVDKTSFAVSLFLGTWQSLVVCCFGPWHRQYINNKKPKKIAKSFLMGEGPTGHWPPISIPSRKLRHFLRATRPTRFKPMTSLSHVTSSTTASHSHLCLYSIFFLHILY